MEEKTETTGRQQRFPKPTLSEEAVESGNIKSLGQIHG